MISEPSPGRVRRGSAVPAKPSVSIIVPVLHDATNAARCLDSIVAAGGPAAEVIVVANGTRDPGLEPLAHREDLILFRLMVNTGFGGACNLASRLARARCLLFVNDDVEVEAGWLEPLLHVVKTVPRIGAVGSLVLFPDGRVQDAGGLVWSNGITTRIGFDDAVVPEEATRLHDVDYVSGCSMLVPRTVWRRLGGFDTAFFPAYFEDVDFGLRLREAGLRVMCEPQSRVRHAAGSSTSAGSWLEFMFTRNHDRLVRRWHEQLQCHPAYPAPDGHAAEQAIEEALRRLASAA